MLSGANHFQVLYSDLTPYRLLIVQEALVENLANSTATSAELEEKVKLATIDMAVYKEKIKALEKVCSMRLCHP